VPSQWRRARFGAWYARAISDLFKKSLRHSSCSYTA
jgi:hypothetical protein